MLLAAASNQYATLQIKEADVAQAAQRRFDRLPGGSAIAGREQDTA
jgi:hypothetical protein